MKLKTVLFILFFTALFTSCTKETQITPVQHVGTGPVQDRGTIKLVTDGMSTSPSLAMVTGFQIITNMSGIPSNIRWDVYGHAPQSSYTQPTSGYQLISQHGPGALSNQSIYPPASTYNTIFSTPYAPDNYWIWFKVEEWDTSGESAVLVNTTTVASQPNGG